MAHPREILQTLGAAPLKSLSQNFLTSPHWAEKLVSAVVEGDVADAYWEIGPGLGALTQVLTRSTQKPITLFEFDRKIAEFLRKTYPDIPLVEGDVLDADFKARCEGKRIHVLSNLPYHLSSPIVFKLAEHRSSLQRLVLTFQREFAERVKAKVGDDLYGALSVILQLQYDISSLGIIPHSAFYPAPSIDSEALTFVPNARTGEEVAQMVPIIKAAFLHPRKKMVNNLKSVFPSVDWAAKLKALHKTDNARAEELSLQEFIALCSP